MLRYVDILQGLSSSVLEKKKSSIDVNKLYDFNVFNLCINFIEAI